MKSVRVLLSVPLLWLTWVAVAQEPHVEPVPEAMIAGDRLQPPGLGFSIQRPGDGWRWTYLGSLEDHNFQAINRVTKRFFMVLVQPIGQELLTQQVAEGFIQGIRGGATDDGAKLVDVGLQPSPIPFPGSFRFSHGIQSKTGRTVYWTGYLIAAGSKRLCVIQELRQSPGESAELTTFVRSFRLIHDETPGRIVDGAPAEKHQP